MHTHTVHLRVPKRARTNTQYCNDHEQNHDDWCDDLFFAGMGGEGLPGAGDAAAGTEPKAPEMTTTSKRIGSMKNGKKPAGSTEEEEEETREKYPWEMDDMLDSGLVINKAGKIVSKEKKLTPQQKKKEKGRGGPAKMFDEEEDSSKGSTTVYRKGDKKPKKR